MCDFYWATLYILVCVWSVHWSLQSVSVGRCIVLCLLIAVIYKMGHFLNTYQNVHGQQDNFREEQLQTILSAVVVLLRRHNIDNQLCCGDDENNLKVTAVDRHGFVTKVRCTKCRKTMDTTCSDANWTKEIIHETQLKVGDHICWHRPYVIWHHAIVTALNPRMVIHYARELEVRESELSNVHCHSQCCDDETRCRKFCGNLYRINYEDCYNAEYTVLRARRLLNEERYNLLDRNCEHFSSWCKTGSTKSSQVSVCWASLGKMAVTIILRVIALLILFFIQWSHEESDEICQGNSTVTSMVSTVTKGRCSMNETVEQVLTSVYIIVVTLVFAIHLVITSCKRLAVDPRSESNDQDRLCPCCPCDPCGRCSTVYQCSECCQSYECCTCPECCQTSNVWCLRCCCCLGRMFYVLCCRAVCCFTWCPRITCSPHRTCCRRPWELACGVFCRIFIREIPGMAFTIWIVLCEDFFSDRLHIQKYSAGLRAFLLILLITGLQIGGYLVGAILARPVEASCECCMNQNENTNNEENMNNEENNEENNNENINLVKLMWIRRGGKWVHLI